MDFGPLPTPEIGGCVLGHTLRFPDGVFKKGRVLSDADVARISAAGHASIVVARLGPDDVLEGAAAVRVAQSICGVGIGCETPFTGRVNLHAATSGIFEVDVGSATELLGLDEGMTFATLAPGSTVAQDQLVATAKVIPFAVSETLLSAWEARAVQSEPCLHVRPFSGTGATFIQTQLPGVPEGVLDRSSASMKARLLARGSVIAQEIRCGHDAAELALQVKEAIVGGTGLVLILGASQIADRADVVPKSIIDAGGTVHRFGLPIDPGNLTLVASVSTVPVLGVPGCARSLRPSGFDVVLDQILAGSRPDEIEVAPLGVGGLLKEIASRPQPRRATPPQS